MNVAVMDVRPVAWEWWRRNSQAWALTVALHGTIVALLVVGWTLEPAPVNAPSVLKTRLINLSAQPQVASAAQPLAVEAPVPVIEAPPKVKPAPVDPQLQVRKLEQAALARKRVAERKQTQQVQEALQAQQAQPLIHAQQRGAEQARLAVANVQRTQQPAAVADVRQYLPISKEAPDYPQRALDKGIEGDCTVEYSVTPQGKVENPKVVGNCHPMFMRPSLLAAATFRYQPRVVDGQAVSVPGVRNTFHYKIQ